MNSPPDSTMNSAITALELILRVDGMSCTRCASVIDTMLGKTRGIKEAKTHFLTDMVQVKYLPHLITPQEILEKIADLWAIGPPCSRSKQSMMLKKEASCCASASPYFSAQT